MRVSTVYLNALCAPGAKDWIKGEVDVSALGVTVFDRDDHRGHNQFFPMHMVQRIAWDTGWGG